MRPAGFVIGILPNALSAIRAMDTDLYHDCLEELTPAENDQNRVVYLNTGELIFQ